MNKYGILKFKNFWRNLAFLTLLLAVFCIPSVCSAFELPVPAYGQRYSFRIPLDINPHNTEIWATPSGNYNTAPVDCGIACASMIEAYHTGDYSENDYVYYSMYAAVNPNAAWTTTSTDMSLSADPTSLAWSGAYVSGWMSPEQILAQLKANHPVMVHKYVYHNPDWIEQHWVVIYGYDGYESSVNWGSFKIMSPYYSLQYGGGVTYQYLSQFISDYSQLNSFMYRANGVLPHRGADFGFSMTAKLYMADGSLAVAAAEDGNIVLETAADTSNQEWLFIQHSNSTYVLQNLRNGQVMDLAYGGIENGTNIGLCTLWSDYDPTQRFQRWYLYNDGSQYRLSPEPAYWRSLSAADGPLTDGTNLFLYDIGSASNQRLTLEQLSDRYLQKITCSRTELLLNSGESSLLTVAYTPQDVPDSRRGVIWTSSDETVATVDDGGLVTARGKGTCTITATSSYHEPFFSSCTVTVENGLEIPQITSLAVSGHSIHLSWSESPATDDLDVRAYEVFVYPKGNIDDYVWSNWNITGTSCDITLSEAGEYDVYVRAVNKTDSSRSDFDSASCMILDDEWLYLDELPDNLQGVEVQYLNQYNDREQTESPGEGWTCTETKTTYVNGNIRFSEDPDPLPESDTLVYLGTFYYHYCDGNNTVEHYWTNQFKNQTRLDNQGQFDVVWQGPDGADPRFTVYRLKWNSGEWAGGLATCPYGYSDAMALYYLGHRYQERTAFVTYVWAKETEWSGTLDPNADSVSYRIRQITYEHRLQLPASITAIEAEAFMNDQTVQEVIIPSGCTYIGSRAFAGCTELKRVYIPGTTIVESDAFEDCPHVQIINTVE